jgi:glutaredoxin-related protein
MEKKPTKKIIVYGSLECSDTSALRHRLEKESIPYKFVDILSSMKSLKAFLNLRDSNLGLFADTVKNGDIGIPLATIGTRLVKDFEYFNFATLKPE